MFYSDVILSRKGPLGHIWLAAHYDKKLTKAQIVGTDISASVVELTSSDLGSLFPPPPFPGQARTEAVERLEQGDHLPPLALRLKGQLLLGIVKIYSRKARYLLDDCQDTVVKIRLV